jgi:hypothetical protein
MSKLSGLGCNYEPAWWVLLLTSTVKFLEQQWPSLWRRIDIMRKKEYAGFSKVPDGFHLKQYRGGIRMGQIYLRSEAGYGTSLSDSILSSRNSIFALLVIGNGEDHDETVERLEAAQAAVQEVGLDSRVLSSASAIVYMPHSLERDNDRRMGAGSDIISPALISEIKAPIPVTYDSASFVDRLGRSTKFAIIRPDFFIFACAKNPSELKSCFYQLQRMVCCDDVGKE